MGLRHRYTERIRGRALFQDPNAPQHGIQVILSWEPRSVIYVDGSANSLEDNSTGKPLDSFGYCIFGLNTIREYAKKIYSFEMRRSKLGVHDAYQYIVRYACPATSQERIEESVVAIPKERGIVYRVTLETTPEKFNHDHKVFFKVVSKWRMIEWK